MPVLFILQTAFSLWLLNDAIKRGAPQYWMLIILVPFGEWVYFFAVKLPDSQFGRDMTAQIGRKLFTRRLTLAQLRVAFEETPSHENRIQLAQSLHDRGQFQEAAEHFEKVLRANEDDKDSLHGYAMCCLNIDQSDMAVRALERLVALDIGYLDYAACSDLAELYARDGRSEQAIAMLRKAVKKSQRIGPRWLLARQLVDNAGTDEARELLRAGLQTYKSSPKHVRRRDRQAANAARRLLRSLS